MLSPGHQTSEFYLALVVVTAILAALWNGKLDPALASALLGLIVSGYPALRTWLKAQHVDAVAAVLAAQGGRGGVVAAALAGAVEGAKGSAAGAAPQSSASVPLADLATATGTVAPALSLPNGPLSPGFAQARTLAALALASALALLAITYLTGCAPTPYYVSGISGTVDASDDGSRITGGGVGVTISPNPNYPLPKGTGFAK